MELQPPSEPVPDPFLAAVRHRHPDVDIVVLPPESTPTPGDRVDDATVTRVVERLREQAAQVWSHVTDEHDDPTVRLAFGPVPGTVVIRSRHSATCPERPRVLADLQETLEADGWVFRRPWGEVERLVGRLDDVELRATYAAQTGALVVVLTSAALVVGPERARELVSG